MTAADGVFGHLAARAAEGRLAVLVGAGLSMGAGYPGWGRLFAPLGQALGPAAGGAPLPDDLPALAEAYEAEYGRNSLVSHLRRELRRSLACTEAHRALAATGLKEILTTNYDVLLEEALQDVAGPVDVVVRDSDLAYTAPARPRLVKMCGDVLNPETLTVTRRDFAVYGAVKPRLAEYVRGLLETHELLVLGAGPSDPEFNMLWDLATAGLGEHKPVGWVLTADVSPLQQRVALTRGLRTLPLDVTDDGVTRALARWLDGLSAAHA
ncbi:SIR2 family protein [Streptomyces sp. NPDC020792]|uniref:SIR2 family protein n=1 Tax=Streptomyces sp. NPDC020792 TaxID=3365089 RepID=UPI003798BB22